MRAASAPGRARVLAAAAAAAACIAGCGSAASQPAPARPPAVPPSLDTSAVAAGGTWAAIVMGGSSAQNNAFGQLFVRPAGTSTWKLVTPPGVATNGGLVLAGRDGRSLLAGFRPGVDLTFSPLTTTSDDGTHWSAASLIQAGLADVPDALAAAPGSSTLLALAQGGTAEESATSGADWTQLATARSLAASAAGRRCSPVTLTAISFTPAGAPLVAGTCARPGVAGIFARSGGTWQAAGPVLPASLAGQATEVLRLTSTPAGNAALLIAGTGNTASLLTAWTTRRRDVLDPIGPAAPQHGNNTVIRLRDRRSRLGDPGRRARRGHQQHRRHLALTARAARRNRHAGFRASGQPRRAHRHPRGETGRLAARTGLQRLG